MLLLTGFAVKEPLAVSLYRLASTEGAVLGNTVMLGTSSGPKTSIWVNEAEEMTDVSRRKLHVVHVASLYSFEHLPSQTTYAVG